MSEHYETIANLIYKECLRWVVDFIEKEISFSTLLDRFQENYNKFSALEDIDLLDLLSDEKEIQLLEINIALEDRVGAIQFDDDTYSEEHLKEILVEIIKTEEKLGAN